MQLLLVLIDSDLLSCYQWIICYLLRQTHAQFSLLKEQKQDVFTAKNDCQMFFARDLSKVFAEVNITIYLQYFFFKMCFKSINFVYSI